MSKARYNPRMRIIGLAGWSGAGKTTLIAKLIPGILARGLKVSTLKHAHHAFDVDRPGKDSYEHRMAGATEVLGGVLLLNLAGVLALSAAIPAHADPPPSKMTSAGQPPSITQRAGRGSGWHPAPGHLSQWKGEWVPPHWGPNGYYGGRGPYGGLAVPTYWVWGPSGGAFDYPFSDWRGPTGGWGNP